MQIERIHTSVGWRPDLRGWSALLHVLDPRELRKPVLAAFLAALSAAALGVYFGVFPLWAGTLLVLVGMLPIGVVKWRADQRLFGRATMLLGALLTVQGLHTVEHVVQWIQYHVLFWTMRQSVGLVSPANAEVVHFVWNWAVLIAVAALMRNGVRNWWTWVLLVVSAVHAVEHTYTFTRHLLVLGELRALGVTDVTAQGLPGIFGRDGWLARSAWTQGTFLCSIPGLTTATRLDLHFYWNTVEVLLLAPAAAEFLRSEIVRGGRATS
jgi:hypothetical protein